MDTMTDIELRPRPWWAALVAGIASIVLGLFLVVAPQMSLIVLVTFLGVYWLVRGIFSIAEIFVGKREDWPWLLVLGLLGIGAGLIVLRHPLYAAALVPTVLVLVLAVDAVILGLVNLYRGFTGAGVWAVVLGLLDLIVAALLFAQPLLAAGTLTITLGVLFIIGGIVLTYLAIRTRSTVAEMERKMRKAA